jgi:hypothetical protein
MCHRGSVETFHVSPHKQARDLYFILCSMSRPSPTLLSARIRYTRLLRLRGSNQRRSFVLGTVPWCDLAHVWRPLFVPYLPLDKHSLQLRALATDRWVSWGDWPTAFRLPLSSVHLQIWQRDKAIARSLIVSWKQATPFPLSQFVTPKLQKIRLPGFTFRQRHLVTRPTYRPYG